MLEVDEPYICGLEENKHSDKRLVTLQRLVRRHAAAGSTVYSDEAPAYEGMPEYRHRSVNYSKGRDFPSRYPSIVEDSVVMPDGRDEQTD